MRTVLASIGLLGVAACGGSALDPGAGNDAGRGTGTLAIDGSAHAVPRMINATETTDFDTELSVRVALGNQLVTTGTVIVTSASGKATLTYRFDNRWSGMLPGYDQVYILDVVSGSDTVEGVRVDGPDLHVFVRPTEGETVDATLPLKIVWGRRDIAPLASLRIDNIGSIQISDTGTYALAPGSLRVDKSQPRPNTLRLTRTNRVTPIGAVPGSSWLVAIDNAVDVIAQPQATPL